MKLLLLAVAERAIRDADTDRMSLVDIVDSVSSESFPYLLPEFSLLTVYHKEPADAESETVVISIANGEEEITSQEQEVGFGGRIGNRTVIRVGGVVLSKPGTFSVSVRHRETTLGSWSIPVALEN